MQRRTKLLGALLIFVVALCGCVSPPPCPVTLCPPAELRPSVLIEIPQTRQATPYTCGVAVLQSLLAYNGILYRQDVLEVEVGATPERGTSPQAIMKCLKNNAIESHIERDMTLEQLRRHIDAGRPVICFLQAWNDDPDFDYSTGWEDGHYAVAIGYDSRRIYFMDPSTLANYAYIDNEQFLVRWHDGDADTQVYQTGIVVSSPNPTYRKDAFSPML